jgi:hypothetical protein
MPSRRARRLVEDDVLVGDQGALARDQLRVRQARLRPLLEAVETSHRRPREIEGAAAQARHLHADAQILEAVGAHGHRHAVAGGLVDARDLGAGAPFGQHVFEPCDLVERALEHGARLGLAALLLDLELPPGAHDLAARGDQAGRGLWWLRGRWLRGRRLGLARRLRLRAALLARASEHGEREQK